MEAADFRSFRREIAIILLPGLAKSRSRSTEQFRSVFQLSVQLRKY
jgi:hypothetical protein